MRNTRSREQREVRLTLAAQDLEVHFRPAEAAGLAENASLRLDRLRDQNSPAIRLAGVLFDAAQVAGELLDGIDGADPLDLDRDPAVLLVPTHQVHGPDVGRPFAPD